MRKGVALSVIGVATALVVLLIYGVASQATDNSIDEAVADGKRPEAASADLPMLGGSGEGSLDDYRGQIVVLNFWASWCVPCAEEAPVLEQAQRTLETQGATVLGVNYKDVPEDALGFVGDHEISFPSLRDGDGEYGEEYATRGIPETFVIDRRGRIAALARGPVDEAWLKAALSPLLAEES